jgi:hypothetical protein
MEIETEKIQVETKGRVGLYICRAGMMMERERAHHIPSPQVQDACGSACISIYTPCTYPELCMFLPRVISYLP